MYENITYVNIIQPMYVRYIAYVHITMKFGAFSIKFVLNNSKRKVNGKSTA